VRQSMQETPPRKSKMGIPGAPIKPQPSNDLHEKVWEYRKPVTAADNGEPGTEGTDKEWKSGMECFKFKKSETGSWKNSRLKQNDSVPRENISKLDVALRGEEIHAQRATFKSVATANELNTKVQRVRVGQWNNKSFTWFEVIDPTCKLPTAGFSEGRIKEVRGNWGFIKDASCPTYDLFFHMSEIAEGWKQQIKAGMPVRYQIVRDQWRDERNSRFKAIQISVKGRHGARGSKILRVPAGSSEMKSQNWRQKMMMPPVHRIAISSRP